MKKINMLLICAVIALQTIAQQKTENVVIVTLDGMRWQEVFGGVDSALMNGRYTMDKKAMTEKFWSDTLQERRRKLFPFLWQMVATNGQLYGNRWENNKVNVANRYQFSYPGYNEIFTGYPDTAVNSNDKVPNSNINVLEFINKDPKYKNKVAAFATWDVFPYILNAKRSGVYVNAGVDTLPSLTQGLSLVNDLQFLSPQPIDVRPDVATYLAAREYLKAKQPRVLYIAFDETDDYAHAGLYDQYLKSAHAEDAMLADLWNTLQSMPQYKNKTTLIVTCDHGRGDKKKDTWRDHGSDIAESGEIWMAFIGQGISSKGEMKTSQQHYQQQLAATIASLLGLNFTTTHPVAPSLSAEIVKQ
ncbi:alkaline phosphatase family protein [Chitinophagaceae bacterium 26-R-25]|nr:alkaline phosphatase family protein [Chitinophagaceae bacterium 26-R-25]